MLTTRGIQLTSLADMIHDICIYTWFRQDLSSCAPVSILQQSLHDCFTYLPCLFVQNISVSKCLHVSCLPLSPVMMSLIVKLIGIAGVETDTPPFLVVTNHVTRSANLRGTHTALAVFTPLNTQFAVKLLIQS